MQNRPHKTYRKDNVWITPLGKYNILHYNHPTDEKIKQRVQETIKEVVDEANFEDDCPLCQLMKKEPYDIVYYCENWCHECSNADDCINFDPDSRKKQASLMEEKGS